MPLFLMTFFRPYAPEFTLSLFKACLVFIPMLAWKQVKLPFGVKLAQVLHGCRQLVS